GRIIKIFPHIAKGSGVCKPVIDIDPELNVFRCFGVNEPKKSLKQFKRSRDIWNFFSLEIDFFKWFAVREECTNCKYLHRKICQGGCISFSYPRILDLKKLKNKTQSMFIEAYQNMKSKNYKLAVAKFEEGLNLYGIDSAIICDYIFALLKSFQIHKAELTLDSYQNILIHGESGIYYLMKGLIAEENQKYVEAMRYYRKAIKKVREEKKPELSNRINNLLKRI
ncbi:unnamed protein product, partial [marine sediment metagenome]